MKERTLYLIEKYIDGSLNSEERFEMEEIVKNSPEIKKEIEEQKKVKEVLSKMKLKNPSKEVWDSYWLGIYNRLERGLAWIAISLGLLVIFAYSSYEMVQSMINDTHTPAFVKIATAVFIFGLLVLLWSVIREKIKTSKKDKYREIQR